MNRTAGRNKSFSMNDIKNGKVKREQVKKKGKQESIVYNMIFEEALKRKKLILFILLFVVIMISDIVLTFLMAFKLI